MEYTEDKNANGLDELTSLDTGDLVIVSDSSDSYRAKKITKANSFDLKANLASPALTGTPTAPTQSASDNSTKLATTAYVDSGISTALSSVSPTCLTLIPQPNTGTDGGANATTNTLNTNTKMYIGQVIIPFKITANKISFKVNSFTGAGTVDLTMYSENGQTQIFSVTTANISGGSVVCTTALPSVVINPGVYYIGVNSNDTLNINTLFWSVASSPFSTTEGLPFDVASEPIMSGTLTITANTPPATITPTAITEAHSSIIIFRLDN